jgi:hypothetical protein
VWSSTAAPPLFRLLWAVGVPVPPPHFCRGPLLFAFSAVWFGSVMGLLLWLGGHRPSAVLSDASLVGAAFGAVMTFYYRGKARRLGLPEWKDFEPQPKPGTSRTASTRDR